MKGENGVPETPDWAPRPRAWDAAKCCPADCPICTTAAESAWMHNAGERLAIPENIELGSE